MLRSCLGALAAVLLAGPPPCALAAGGGETGAGAGAAAAAPLGAAPLGATEAELRNAFGDTLRQETVRVAPTLTEQVLGLSRKAEEEDAAEPPPEPADRFPDQIRLVRQVPTGDAVRAEYELYRGRVYRIRWRLAQRFEHHLMPGLIKHLSARLGEPVYDQTLKAKLGSQKADRRRTGWRKGSRALEVRQLHPFDGGPLFLTVTDLEAAQAVIDAGGTLLPEPESSGPWWKKPRRTPRLLTTQESTELLSAVDLLVTQAGF